MFPIYLASWLVLIHGPTAHPRRAIDRCAQDGAWFYAQNDVPATPVKAERDGVTVQIEHPDSSSTDALITFSVGSQVLTQRYKDFEATQGWLTVSPSHAFATTWKENASSAETHLYRLTNERLAEDSRPIRLAEETFAIDAKRFCKTPGSNVTAIKWLDDHHLLLAINAWASGFCESNFTEGFVLSLPKLVVERKLSEPELIDLPAVCTWNLVPVKRR